MNSREKQRRAMHASNGLVAKVRQLPTFMKVINVVLALVLALGVGQNWAYAAELIPEGVQDTFTLNSTNTQATLTAPSVDGASSYQWQIKDLNTNEFFDVAGQTESTFDVTAGLIDNALNSENVATLCVVSKDSEGNNLSTQEYYVKVDKSSNNLAEEANDAIQPSIDAQTEFANGLAENDGEAVEGENKAFTVEVKFTDARGYDLGYVITNKFEVTAEKGFDWLIRVNTDLGTCTACTDSVKDTAKFKAEPMASEGFNNGIYIQGFPGLETVEGDTITVNAIINVAQYYYTIIAKYQDLTTPTVYDEYVVTKTAELTTKFPSQTEIDYFVNGGEVTNPTTGETKYGTGWKLQDYQTRSVTKDYQPEAGDNPGPGTRGVEVTLTLDRQYGLLSFDLGDEGEPQNCPDKVYMKNGQPFSDISAWNRSSTVTLPPDPDRVPYKFIGWRYQVPGTTSYVNMPTDTWNNLKAPGVERVYEARWDLPGTVTTTRVTLAYWCEKADSNDFEYVIERYANVPIGKVGEPYILPMDGSDMQRHPENDRRIPQVRASKSDEVTLKVPNQYETVPNSKDWVQDSYTFNDLYSYSKYEEGVTIKEDGSTVVKVYLTRKTFTLTYNSSRGNTTITKKWDADIQTEFAQACQKASGEAGRTCRWESNKTGTATAYIRNMTKYNDTFTYDKTFPTTSERPLRYYIQKLGMPSTLDKAWDKAAENTSYSANWVLLVSIPAEFNYTTSDEYIPLLGFDTPTQNVTGPPWNRGTGALGGDLSYFWYNHGVRYSSPHGLSYYYTRHKNGLYLYNFHGVNDVDPQTNKPWHYDFCVSVGDAEYDLPIGQFKFTENERAEESSGSYKTGITGITAGDTLANYTATLIAPPDDLEHYLFEGWYTEDTFDPASKVDLETWTMQDHEQNLYANWKCPERKVRFNTKDDIAHSQTETKGDAKTCLYDTLVPSEYIPIFEQPEGYHFTSWYYYLTAEDKAADKKTWFDPETMELPWTTYDEYTNSNDDTAVLTLHQEWTENKEVDYEFHFELDEGGGKRTEIAPYVQGTGKAGETITYDTETKPVSDYYSGYGGFVVADPTKYDMELQFIPEGGDNPNIYTFVYHWDSEARYHVRVEYYAYDKDSATPITQIGSRESGTRDQDSGWTAVPANEFKYSYKPNLHPAAPYDEYLLLSATTITTTLTPDSEKEQGQLYPWANIIEVYYAPAGTVDFTYNVKTYTDNTHQTLAPAGTSGGYVLDGATHAQTYKQTGVPVYTGTGTATAGLNPGCKFDGWYSTRIEDGEVVLGDKVDEQYVRYVQALNQWILTCPKTDSLYVNDAEYWAVFTYDNTGFDINYKVQVIDGNGNNINVAGVTLKVGDAGTPADNVKQTLANPFATISNVQIAQQVSYYPYAKWVDSSGATVTAPTEGTPFTTPKKHFEEGTISYDYYVPETYTCIFDERENDAAAISYVVKTGFADYGELSLNVTPYAYDDSAEESILPYIGNPQYGTTANPRVLGAVARVKSTSASEYKFTGWTKEGSPEVLSTSPTFIPGKVGNVYQAATYVANFERNVFTVSWDITDQKGTIDPNTTAISVLSETVFNTDQATGKITFNEPGKTPAQYAHTPVPFPGYQYSKWVMLNASGEEVDITNTTITSNITLRPKFVDYNTVYAIYRVWDADLDKGFVMEDDDDNHQQRMTSYRQNLNSLNGLIWNASEQQWKDSKYSTVSADGMAGYQFDHWSEIIDGVDTPVLIEGQPAPQNNFSLPSTTVDGHTYYETGRTFYAHFKTFTVDLTIQVNTTQSTYGQLNPGGTQSITVDDVVTQTKYSIGTDIGTGDKVEGMFYLGQDEASRELQATALAISGQAYEFSNWTMLDADNKVVPIPASDAQKVITRATTFIANFKPLGERDYEIHYFYQKLNNEQTAVTNDYVTLSSLPTTDPAHREKVGEVEYGDVVNVKAAPESDIIIPLSDVVGFNLRTENPYVSVDGDVDNGVWTLDDNAGKATLNVYMSRETEFHYALQFMVETADSARDNRDNPAIDFEDREYEGTYLQNVTWSRQGWQGYEQKPLVGIYGTVAYVYEHPWEAKDITFVYDGPVINNGGTISGESPTWAPIDKTVPTWHYSYDVYHAVEENLPNRQYYIGTTETTPGAGAVTAASEAQSICYLYANRGTEYPFVAQYYTQNIENDNYSLAVTVQGTDTEPASKVGNFKGINDDHIVFATTDETGKKTLDTKFNVAEWNIQVPDKTYTYASLFQGLTFVGTDQENDTLLNSSYTTGEKTAMGYPICKVYFDRKTDLQYKINYYQEPVESAEARAAGEATYPDFTGVTPETITYSDGRTGAEYSLTGDVYKNRYSSAGYTWYAGSDASEDVKSATKIIITVDPETGLGNAEVDIYYILDTNVSFAIEYYNEKVTHTDDPADKYETTAWKKTSMSGVLGATVYTDDPATHSQPAWLTPDFRISETGFNPNYSKSVPLTSATVTYGLVIKLYYDRNTTTKWTVEYYQQDLNTAKTDVVNTYTKKDTDINTDGRTGDLKDFTAVVTGSVNKYQFFTQDHVTIDTTGAYPGEIVVSPNYNIRINADGSSIVRIFYNRQQVPYQIEHWKQQLDEAAHQTPTDNYTCNDRTTGRQGYVGTVVTLNYASFIGYKASTTKDPVPANRKLEIGNPDYTYDVEGTMTTVGKLYYDFDEVNQATYNVVVNYETDAEAIDRRDHPETHVLTYGLQKSATQQAYPGQYIYVNSWKTGIQTLWPAEHFEAFNCVSWSPTGENAAISVGNTENNQIVLYLQRKTDLNVNVMLIKEQLRYAKGQGGQQYIDDDPTTEYINLANRIYGETIDMKATYGNYYRGQTPSLHYDYHEGYSGQTGTLTVPPTGTATGKVYYLRGKDLTYKVGYRIEDVEHAKDPTKGGFDNYKDTEWQWTITDGIEGDTITFNSPNPQDESKTFASFVTEEGYSYWYSAPSEGRYISGATPADQMVFELYYKRATNYIYYIQAYVETLEWAKGDHSGDQWELSGYPLATISNQVYEDVITLETQEVKDFIAAAKSSAALVGFTYDASSSTGITVGVTEGSTVHINFTRNWDNKVYIKHYGEKLDSAWARIDQPESEWDPEYDMEHAIAAVDTITGTADNKLLTGDTYAPISDNKHTYNVVTDKEKTWYGFDYREVDPEADSLVISGNWEENVGTCLYIRHFWTVTPDPDPDPDIPEPFFPEDPDPFPVPEGGEVVIDPDPEEYIYPDPVDPFPAHGDEDVPIYYHQKNVQIYYKVNDAALGSVDPEENTYPVITGTPIGSSATNLGAATFLNWTNEAGEVVSTDANYIPEKVPVIEPENGFNAAANADPSIYGEPFVYTANFQAGTGGQTSDNVNPAIVLALISLALVGAFVFMRRSREMNKCVNSAKHVR